MSFLLSVIDWFARPRRFVVLLGLYGVVFGAILISLSGLQQVSGGHGILDFEIGYDPHRVDAVLGSYPDEGWRLYARIQVLDLLNPALYSLVLAVLTHWVWRGTGREGLALLALVGGLGDYLENATLFAIARAYPQLPEGLIAVSSGLSLLKNGLLALSVLPLLIGLLRRLRLRRASQVTPQKGVRPATTRKAG